LDLFSSEYATALEHKYVDNRSMVDELREMYQQPKVPGFQDEALNR